MIKSKISFLLLPSLLVAAAFLLSACGGQPAESWPGISLDLSSNTAFVAFANHIYRVDLNEGREIWRFPTKNNSRLNLYAPPLIAPSGELLVGGFDHIFYSLDPTTDYVNWTFVEAKDRFIAAAALAGDTVLAPNADGHLYALDRRNGRLLWKFAAKHALWSSPLVAGERLYLASMDHHVYALRVSDGSEIWRSADLGGQIVAAPLLSDPNTLIVAIFGARTDDPQRASKLLALDVANGQVRWSLPIAGWVFSTPLLHEGVVYFGDTAGFFYAVDAQSGTLLWQQQPQSPPANHAVIGAPALLGETLIFASKSGTIYGLNPANGSERWSKALGGQFYASVQTADDLALLAPIHLNSTLLLAVDSNGVLRWQFTPQK